MIVTKTITLTGVDRKTPFVELEDLARRANVEIGILLSLGNKDNRYPPLRWIETAVDILGRKCAVHVCGRLARHELFLGKFPWISRVGRLQLNGAVTATEARDAAGFVTTVITQARGGVWDLVDHEQEGHCILVDQSGGRGISPAVWKRPATAKLVGFAGGLGPDNLAHELDRISQVAEGDWWVDMESKLRGSGDDFFSLRKAHVCVDVFHRWLRGE